MIQSPINNPNVSCVLQSLASLIHANVLEDLKEEKKISSESQLYLFSEEKYIKERSSDFDEERIELLRKTPSKWEILGFLEEIYKRALFSPECLIISYIYIDTLTSTTEMPMLPNSWRILIIISLMIAQKMWDDNNLLNSDFQFIYPFFEVEQFNILEIKFLELIDFNTHIKMSLYSKYYSMFEKNCKKEEFTLRPMDVYTEGLLIKRSKQFEEKLKYASKTCGLQSIFGINTPVIIN